MALKKLNKYFNKRKLNVMYPAPRRYTAKKTNSTRESIAIVAGSNIYTLTLKSLYYFITVIFYP